MKRELSANNEDFKCIMRPNPASIINVKCAIRASWNKKTLEPRFIIVERDRAAKEPTAYYITHANWSVRATRIHFLWRIIAASTSISRQSAFIYPFYKACSTVNHQNSSFVRVLLFIPAVFTDEINEAQNYFFLRKHF
jgi:hypothetical protein